MRLRAQLAITEVMSSASTNFGNALVPEGPDFWELTNFGETNINLAGYEFADDTSVRRPLNALIIAPGESVIFFRDQRDPPLSPWTEEEVRALWGPCLPSQVRLRAYPTPGFSAGNGDAISLYDPSRARVDSVRFGVPQRGRTFTYNPDTGELDRRSAIENGACQGAAADNVGSPGVTSGTVPLRILEQPASLTLCAGPSATFSVRSAGLPRARYQWFRNGTPISGAVSASFTITNAQPSNEGEYEVELNNGLTVLRSAKASLIISTNETAPEIVERPVDLEVYQGQAARFFVTVCAFPPAYYQWLSNNVPIPGATNRQLRLPIAQLGMSGAEFCVRITNSHGSTSACARLSVIAKPDLRITEIMAFPSTNCGTGDDWFEVTNFGTNAVNLRGYRFFDQYVLETAAVVTQSLVLRPGQSAIFVEDLTREQFLQWWGADNLPPDLAIVPHTRFSFSADLGDIVYIWNAAAEVESDQVASTSFSSATHAASLYFSTNQICFYGCDSAAGASGAFQAAACDDIGSPGYVTNPPPRFVNIERLGGIVTLRWRATVGKSYQVFHKDSPTPTGWALLNGPHLATNSIHTATDATAAGLPQRFYRIEESP